MVIIICMFISSCSQEDSNPMFETNSETHINNLESKALPSVLVTIWIDSVSKSV